MSVCLQLSCQNDTVRLVQVSGLGTFQVRISTLRRTRATTTTSTVLSSNGTVPTCRMFVRFCLTNYQYPEPAVPFGGRCEFSEETSPAWTGCSLLYLNVSAISMKFTFTWPVCNATKTAITSKIKHATKHKTSPARLAALLQPSLAFCFSLQPMTAYRFAVIGCKLKQNAKDGCNSCATVVQVLRDLFYVLLHVLFYL